MPWYRQFYLYFSTQTTLKYTSKINAILNIGYSQTSSSYLHVQQTGNTYHAQDPDPNAYIRANMVQSSNYSNDVSSSEDKSQLAVISFKI